MVILVPTVTQVLGDFGDVGPMTEDFFPAIWNILHDGVIVAVNGILPGDLLIDVEIDYLRKRIPDPGTLIQVLLVGCTRFAYRQYEKSEFSIALGEIAAMGPEIVTASMKDGVCEVDCTAGTLEVVAGDGAIRLDSGREFTLQELKEVADSYWKQWSEHWAKVKLEPKK
jgi:hypothetical protein